MFQDILKKLNKGLLPIDFNWNTDRHPGIPVPHKLKIEPSPIQAASTKFISEDLRDGLHGIPEYPAVEQMISHIDALSKLGIETLTIGIYPGENLKIDSSICSLLSYMNSAHPEMTPIVLVIANEKAVKWAAKCKEINPKLTALIFIGTAPSRLLVEEWDKNELIENLGNAIKTAVSTYDIQVVAATEHTTQTPPSFLKSIIGAAVKNGAFSFCIADTIGLSRPVGVHRIIGFVKSCLKEYKSDISIEWHGHDDFGNGHTNAISAVSAGANRIHVVTRGIGERAGNTRMESVLLNLAEILKENKKLVPWNLSELTDVIDSYSKITNIPPSYHGPLGQRAFCTSLGIHTAAILKAEKLSEAASLNGNSKIAAKLDRMKRTIYCAVDAESIGRKREFLIGPWSGKSTVQLACIHENIDTSKLDSEKIQMILSTARQLGRELTKEELKRLVNDTHD